MDNYDLLNQPTIQAKTGLTQEMVKHLFDYKDGMLYHRVSPKYKPKLIGQRAACLSPYKNGDRWKMCINKKRYYQARIVYLWHNGWLPDVVDHENRITTDDKIKNLRAADKSKNSKNSRSRIGSTSKYLGVCWDKREVKWHVQIRANGAPKHVAYVDDEDFAALLYNREAVRHHGEFANLNIIIPKLCA